MKKHLSQLALLLFLAQSLFAAVPVDPNALPCAGPGFKLLCENQLVKPSDSVTPGLGPRFSFKSDDKTSKRDLSKMDELRMLAFNTMNLQESVGRFEIDPKTGEKKFIPGRIIKPESEVLGVCEAIKRANPDMAVLTEVESIHALDAVNRKCLEEQYFLILIEGNDDRGIDVSFLVKKDLPFDMVIQSQKLVHTQYLGKDTIAFSRDFPVLEIRMKGADPKSTPLMILAGTHLKSQRDSGKKDPGSREKRRVQVETMTQILKGYESRYKTPVPFFTMGDFNGDLQDAPEFKGMSQSGYVDSFNAAKIPVGDPRRTSHVFFDGSGKRDDSQLDGIFISQKLADCLGLKSIEALPYLDKQGKPKPLPKNHDERDQNPSDHYPLLGIFDFSKILNYAKECF